jgi:hypothetical protein
MMTSPRTGTTPVQKRRRTTSRPRRTRRQGVSCTPGRLTKMMVGTLMTEPMAMTAPPVMTVPEMMAVTGAAAMTMATSAQLL